MIFVWKDTKKQKKQLGGPFEKDKEMFQIYNSLARTYNCIPSDLLGLSWHELLFNVQCLKIRSEQIDNMMRQSNRKKAMLFPTINITDIVDVI